MKNKNNDGGVEAVKSILKFQTASETSDGTNLKGVKKVRSALCHMIRKHLVGKH